MRKSGREREGEGDSVHDDSTARAGAEFTTCRVYVCKFLWLSLSPPFSPSLPLSLSLYFALLIFAFFLPTLHRSICMCMCACVCVLLASYFHICLKSIYRKLTEKYAKLARSQISATVSGYNCGKSARRVGRGERVGKRVGGKCCRRFSVLCLCLHVIAVCLFA